jgi:stage V sporulation protein S
LSVSNYPSFLLRKLAMSLIKVFSRSRASAVAGAIAGIIREHQQVELLAFGEAAVNRALRAVDLAIVYCRQMGLILAV